jgi:hypothetical protein
MVFSGSVAGWAGILEPPRWKDGIVRTDLSLSKQRQRATRTEDLSDLAHFGKGIGSRTLLFKHRHPRERIELRISRFWHTEVASS